MMLCETQHDFGGPDPGFPQPGEIQVFLRGNDRHPAMVEFLCPCGCGRTCPVHVLEPGETHDSVRPRVCWEFSRGPRGGVTLSPSVRYRGGCKAHFNLTDGEFKIHDA